MEIRLEVEAPGVGRLALVAVVKVCVRWQAFRHLVVYRVGVDEVLDEAVPWLLVVEFRIRQAFKNFVLGTRVIWSDSFLICFGTRMPVIVCHLSGSWIEHLDLLARGVVNLYLIDGITILIIHRPSICADFLHFFRVNRQEVLSVVQAIVAFDLEVENVFAQELLLTERVLRMSIAIVEATQQFAWRRVYHIYLCPVVAVLLVVNLAVLLMVN